MMPGLNLKKHPKETVFHSHVSANIHMKNIIYTHEKSSSKQNEKAQVISDPSSFYLPSFMIPQTYIFPVIVRTVKYALVEQLNPTHLTINWQTTL